ncbi:hypothetical protein Hanom_Chr11g01041471 [Helianthus anomalus]
MHVLQTLRDKFVCSSITAFKWMCDRVCLWLNYCHQKNALHNHQQIFSENSQPLGSLCFERGRARNL